MATYSFGYSQDGIDATVDAAIGGDDLLIIDWSQANSSQHFFSNFTTRAAESSGAMHQVPVPRP